MFKKINWFNSFLFATLGAIAFAVPAFIYIQKAAYQASWYLFLGAGLFFAVMAMHIYRESKLRGENESTIALVFIAHVTTILGVLISTLFIWLLLSFLVPGYYNHGNADEVLANAPANTIADKTNGLSFKAFAASTIICFAGGSIAGILIPFYAKRNQSKDSREPTPLQQSSIT